ncbi:hypothetical protein LLG95_01025 [bacterium]|nr:hypothetical protein [bacterium]
MINRMKQWLSGGAMLLPLFLISLVITVAIGGGGSRNAKSSQIAPVPVREPGIKMIRVNAEVTEDGLRTQQFTARTARLNSDPKAKNDYQTLLMDDIQIQFYDEGKSQGTAKSPAGKMWLADKGNNIHRNDLLLVKRGRNPVEYAATNPEIGTLRSSNINYLYKDRLLHSGQFERIFQFSGGPFQSQGTQLNVKLTTGTTQLKEYTEKGNPVVWRPIEKKKDR